MLIFNLISSGDKCGTNSSQLATSIGPGLALRFNRFYLNLLNLLIKKDIQFIWIIFIIIANCNSCVKGRKCVIIKIAKYLLNTIIPDK